MMPSSYIKVYFWSFYDQKYHKFFFIFFIFQQLQSQLSQIDKNGYNPFCDETLHLYVCVYSFQQGCFPGPPPPPPPHSGGHLYRMRVPDFFGEKRYILGTQFGGKNPGKSLK